MECHLVICRGPFYLLKDTFWEFLQFVVFSQTEKIWNFFDGPLHILCMGREVKNDMSGQSKDALRVCNVKIRQFLLGPKQGTSSWLFGLTAPSVEQFELFFSKMVKLEEKESPDPKLSDFEWFG